MGQAKNRGIISKNDYKNAPNQPDLTGDLDVEGTTYRVSGWYEARGARKYISLSLRKAVDVATAKTERVADELSPDKNV